MVGRVDLSPGCGDPESLAALVAPASVVSGTIWDDQNFDNIFDVSELPFTTSVTVELFYDADQDGVLDNSDFLIQTTQTDALGQYSFPFAALGSLIVKLDESSLPQGYALTGANLETAVFTDNVNFGEVDNDNNFGIAVGADCDGDGIPDFVEAAGDTDGDGVNDDCDLDADNDGILDSVEGVFDKDLDGTPDYLDLDSDNDGIPNAIEINNGIVHPNYNPSTGRLSGADTDMDGLIDIIDNDPTVQYGPGSFSLLAFRDRDIDGIFDHLDLDSDNDGILDVIEAGGIDANNDGFVDSFSDTNLDGYNDVLTASPLSTPNTDRDFETSNGLTLLADYLDQDSDADGILDSREGPSTSDFFTSTIITDQDSDGILDLYDITFSGSPTVPVDTDNDMLPDYIDPDTDDDGIVDAIEGNDADFNGVADIAPIGVDDNGNGVDDALENCTQSLALISTDYAEENAGSGVINLTSSDLELTEDGGVQQEVGIHFSSVAIEPGTAITNAYLQFQTDEVSTGAISLTIFGEGVANAPVFNTTNGNVSGRTKIGNSGSGISWTPADWNTIGEEDLAQQSPDISAIITEIISLPGWASGSSMAFIITGTGRRAAETNPSLIIETDQIGNVCNSLVALQNTDNDAEPDFRDAENLTNPGIFFVVCDASDELAQVNQFNGDFTTIGSVVVPDIEAIAYWPGNQVLYAADAGDLGVLNQTTGAYTLIGEIDGGGTASGSLGEVNLNDVDGLTFDPWTGILWASNRFIATNDVIFQIDTSTGNFIPDAFGSGLDYLEVQGNGVYDDVDDIAISPVDGEMFTLAVLATAEAQILRINKNTGAISVVSDLDRTDIEGLAYYNDGTFWGTVGTTGEFVQIFLDGSTSLIEDLSTSGCNDPEAIAALVGPANEVCGNIFDDVDLDGQRTGAEVALANVTVDLYIDENANGIIDGSDQQIQSTTSDINGDYQFFFAATGQLIVRIDQSTLPVGYGVTTPTSYIITFNDNINFGEQSCDNNFGGAVGNDCDGDGVPDFQEANTDLDMDGLIDACDLDSDNDGIMDAIEGEGDKDGDGIPDKNDLDSDNDGIPDALEANGGIAPAGYNASTGRIEGSDDDMDGLVNVIDSEPTVQYGSSVSTLAVSDSDGDGLSDAYDLDSDNDGILDVIEAGGIDTDQNGFIDNFLDDNGDGLSDALPASPLNIPNSDASFEISNALPQRPDYIDIDSDGDGLEDTREGQTTSGYSIPNQFQDTNNNGIVDFYDISLGGASIIPIDTDGDTLPDYQDTDSDDDTISDSIESNDANNDGVEDIPFSGSDTDGDGLDDNFDSTPTVYGGTTTSTQQNFDGDVEPDWRDNDDDGDGIGTANEPGDLNMNGVPDYLEASPCGPGFTQVGNSTIAGNADNIVASSGVPDDGDVLNAPDGNGASFRQRNDVIDVDLTDTIPAGTTYSLIWRQRPGQNGTSAIRIYESIDNVNYNQNPDSQFSTNIETFFAESIVAAQDTRYLRIEAPNNRDSEIDAIVYSFTNISCEIDFDQDGVVDSDDLDDDNDGIPDIDESFGLNPNADADNDGRPDYLDPDFVHPIYGSCVDNDMDGSCELSVWDADGDGLANHLDLDADNDGLSDALEANGGTLPPNINTNGQFSVSFVLANDADGDGLADQVDPSEGGMSLPLPDSDFDGTLFDFLDLDSDGDGLVDAAEANNGVLPDNMDSNGRFSAAYASANDADGDGIVDDVDLTQGGIGLPNTGTDNDGVPNYLDSDSDQDGLPDSEEGFTSMASPSGNDSNGDGLDDAFDPNLGGTAADYPDGDCNFIPDAIDFLYQTVAPSGSWSSASTWNSASVPPEGTAIVITSGTALLLDVNVTFGAVIIEAGATLNLNGLTANINGDFEVLGTVTGTGQISLSGSCPQTISGTPTIQSLTINNTNGVTLDAGTSLTVTGVLNLSDGEFDVCSGALVLRSDAANTAMVNSQGNGSINCDVRVERYVDGCTNWMMLGPSVSNGTLAEWNDDFATAGYPGAVNPSAGANVFTYNETVSGDTNNGYEAPSSSADNFIPGLGYFVLARPGDLPATFDVTGTLNTGSVELPITYTVTSGGNDNDGYNLVSNPFAATLDWYSVTGWTKISCCDAIFSWNRCLGQYSSFAAGVEVNSGSQFIAPGQGFWVKVHAPDARVAVTDEATSFNNVPIFRERDTLTSVLKFTMTNTSNPDLQDEAAINFVEGALSTLDFSHDAEKFWSIAAGQPAIYSLDSIDDRYAINGLPDNLTDGTIRLGIWFVTAGEYELSFEEDAAFPQGTCIMLEDKLTGAMVDVLEDQYLISETEKGKFYEDRLYLHFSMPPKAAVQNVGCNEDTFGSIEIIVADSSRHSITWNELASNSFRVEDLPPGTYTYSITNELLGCTHNGSVNVEVGYPVVADFEFGKTVYEVNEVISLENNSYKAMSYQWDFGNGKISRMAEPTISFTSPGEYAISLEATNGQCSDLLSKDILVIETITGLTDGVDSQDFLMFPNPTEGIFTMKLPELAPKAEVTVINSLGELVYELNIENQSEFKMDLSGREAGIYLVMLRSKDNLSYGKLIIVD